MHSCIVTEKYRNLMLSNCRKTENEQETELTSDVNEVREECCIESLYAEAQRSKQSITSTSGLGFMSCPELLDASNLFFTFPFLQVAFIHLRD